MVDTDPLELGRPFDTSVFGLGVDGDLEFRLSVQGSPATIGNVEYFTPSDYADFDVDGEVDGQDFLAWQRGAGLNSGAALADGDADFDGDVDADDLSLWQAAYSTSTFDAIASHAATQAVPEPTSVLLGCVGLIVACVRRTN